MRHRSTWGAPNLSPITNGVHVANSGHEGRGSEKSTVCKCEWHHTDTVSTFIQTVVVIIFAFGVMHRSALDACARYRHKKNRPRPWAFPCGARQLSSAPMRPRPVQCPCEAPFTWAQGAASAASRKAFVISKCTHPHSPRVEESAII